MSVPRKSYPAAVLAMVASLFGILATGNQAYGQDQQKKQAVRFPKDAEDPILEYDIVGGFRMANPREFTPSPKLMIFADGKVVCGQTAPRFAEVEYRMDVNELKKLMEFVVNEQDLYSISKKRIDTQILESGQRVLVADGTTMIINVDLERGSHRCEIYALEMVKNQFPQIAELKRASNIQQRLRALLYRAHFGTDERKDEVLSAVNAALKKQAPDMKPLTMSDVQFASTLKNKSFSTAFHRDVQDEDGKFTHNVHVKYQQASPTAEPTINVRVLPVAER